MKTFLSLSGLARLWGYVTALVATKGDKVAVVEHGTGDTTITLTPNVLHRWGVVTALDISFASAESDFAAEYMFEFASGSTATELTMPSSVKWDDKLDTPLTIEAGKIYQVSVEHNIGLLVSVVNA